MALADTLESLSARSPRLGLAFANAALPRILPITRGMGLRVVELTDHKSVVRMPLKARTRNHVGGMYLGALLIACEVAMATRVFRTCRPDRFGVLVTETHSRFFKQGKAPVLAVCEPSDELRARLEACLSLASRAKDDPQVGVTVVDEKSGDELGGATFSLSIMKR